MIEALHPRHWTRCAKDRWLPSCLSRVAGGTGGVSVGTPASGRAAAELIAAAAAPWWSVGCRRHGPYCRTNGAVAAPRGTCRANWRRSWRAKRTGRHRRDGGCRADANQRLELCLGERGCSGKHGSTHPARRCREARAPALPDATFSGRVGALLPELNPTTRTIRARIELTNPRGALLPGMFVSLRFPCWRCYRCAAGAHRGGDPDWPTIPGNGCSGWRYFPTCRG